MNDWTAGYVMDNYTFGCYPELTPVRSTLALLNAGYSVPEFATACELGFGQGISINLQAASHPIAWYGTDFNPSQAALAQDLAKAAGSNARLFDQAFADFCAREDLPDFDFIGLHGIWTWISDENRRVVVDFIGRKLKVGGLLYISYNTQPGWAASVPLRELLNEHARVMGAPGHGTSEKVRNAIAFADCLLGTKPTYLLANPTVADRLKKIKGQDPIYVAHEYFNRSWDPVSFAQMAEWLSPAKLSFACSAKYLDLVDGLNVTAEQQAFLNGIPDAMFRETVRDFMVNQQFRRDYWIKGPQRLSMLERVESLRAYRLVLVQSPESVSLKATGSLGEATLPEATYTPILRVFADHKPKTLGQVEQAIRESGISFPQLLQAALVLVGIGTLSPATDEQSAAKSKDMADKINRELLRRARGSGDITYLASPVLGCGFPVPRFDQLFLLARQAGLKTPAEWATYAWQLLGMQGQTLLKDGRVLQTSDENLAELNTQAETFAKTWLPTLKALAIA